MRLGSICGNEHAKRAVEVALAGGHSILFIGAHDSQAEDLAEFVRQQERKNGWYCRALAVAPCPCGNYGGTRKCTCSIEMVHRWRTNNFPTSPMDITIDVIPPPDYKLLAWAKTRFRSGEPDENVIARVRAAYSHHSEIAGPDETGVALLRVAIQQLQLGPKQVRSIMAVAATIARLADSDSIQCAYLAEAIQYQKEY